MPIETEERNHVQEESRKENCRGRESWQAHGCPEARARLQARHSCHSRVTQVILDAAKAYKKSTGTSFYALDHDTIRERLIKEGYLKATEAGASA